MKEKLQEYALIAEIFSALAIVASLIFVGLQMRQQSEETALNTRAIETAAYQDLISQIGEINRVNTGSKGKFLCDKSILVRPNYRYAE